MYPAGTCGPWLWHLAKSRTPRHDPAHEQLPTWVTEWHAAYDSGTDVTSYEGRDSESRCGLRLKRHLRFTRKANFDTEPRCLECLCASPSLGPGWPASS